MFTPERLADSPEEQGVIWGYYKPRHTHAWNMLVLSWRELEAIVEPNLNGFETEYYWENFILRLWLYRTTVRTLARLKAVENEANEIIASFDNAFARDGKNQLQALRNMIEHFDERAAGIWRGLGSRRGELDPFRHFDRDTYERGLFKFERRKSYTAAIKLRSDAEQVSSTFINWYKASQA
jgi:hypothetical protein